METVKINTNKFFKDFEIGEIYAIPYGDLLGCDASPHGVGPKEFPYWKIKLTLRTILNSPVATGVNVTPNTPLIVQYKGQNKLQEIASGKTILLTDDNYEFIEEDLEYGEALDILNMIYDTPLIVDCKKLQVVTPSHKKEYVNRSKSMSQLLDTFEPRARKMFCDSLKIFANLNRDVADWDNAIQKTK